LRASCTAEGGSLPVLGGFGSRGLFASARILIERSMEIAAFVPAATRWRCCGDACSVSGMNKNISSLLLLLGACLAFCASGCNTMDGAGKDIERAGEKIQEGADNNR
jgi:entericidin B